VKEMTDSSSIPYGLYFVFPIIWVAILMLFSVYDGRKNIKAFDEFLYVTFGSTLAAVTLAGTLFLTYRDTSRFLFLSFVVLAYLFLIFWRVVARIGFTISSRRIPSRQNVLIVGCGKIGQEVFKQINNLPTSTFGIVGYLDDNPNAHVDSGKILGTLNDARNVIIEQNISDVIIALPQKAHERSNQLVVALHDLPVKVLVVPDYLHLALHTAMIDDFAGLPMLDLRAPALSDYQRMVKRSFDILISILVLPFSLIISIFISFAIYTEDKGPLLFKQKRVGENGRLFTMYKFRTMRKDAESQTHLVEQYDSNGNLIHKTSNDPRVTRVGLFLRRKSLDEIPQLINVLKGDMSLVGPRPELPYLVDKYELWQRKRFTVPQGITGWWQIHGRSDKPMHLHTEDDLYYVQNYSLFLDIYILFKTVIVVLGGKGAY